MPDFQAAKIVSFHRSEKLGLLLVESGDIYRFGVREGTLKFAFNDDVSVPREVAEGSVVPLVYASEFPNIETFRRRSAYAFGSKAKIRVMSVRPLPDLITDVSELYDRIELPSWQMRVNDYQMGRLKLDSINKETLHSLKEHLEAIYGSTSSVPISSPVDMQAESNPGTERIPHFDELWESIAKNIFSGKYDFLQWLTSPHEALQNDVPIKLLKKGGDFDLLKRLLGRLEHGIMA